MLCACKTEMPRVIWTEGATDPATGKTVHTLALTGAPAGADWTLWFSQFRTPVEMMPGSQATIEHVSGTLYRLVPQASWTGGDLVLQYEARALINQCRAPEGFYLEKKGEKPVPIEVEYVYQPAEAVKSFETKHVATTAFDMIPRLKQVARLDGTADPKKTPGPVEYVKGQVPGWYKITLDEDIKIQAVDEAGAYYASVTLDNIRRNAAGKAVDKAVITDWPDLPFRGQMLDVSRNFTKKENLLKLIDILAHYKVNYLHLHMGDDEGWRVEIDGLPELTSYGAFRQLPVLQEDGTIAEPVALQPTYCVTDSRDDLDSPGNGYYSKADFIEILRFAWERQIRIVPEFDTPGHSRAAIKSMEYRAEHTGDRSYLLSEPEDQSVYESVQDYTDNAINVALPTTYAFIEKVFDGLIALYAEAGVPLEAIHVGGDEVPEGAWVGSPACQKLMAETGRTVEDLTDYYFSRVLEIAERKGVKVAGWQEIAAQLHPDTFEKLRKHLAFTNIWAVSRGRDEQAYRFANAGLNVVLSNASNNYFDMAYNDSKLERGHDWAAFTDERRSFSFLPYNVYRTVRWDDHRKMRDISRDGEGKTPLLPQGRPNVIGVEGHLWAETLRSFDHVTYYLFPKALGLYERGWNATPVWEGTTVADDPLFMDDFDAFFSIITDHEYPYYDNLGISYHRN